MTRLIPSLKSPVCPLASNLQAAPENSSNHEPIYRAAGLTSATKLVSAAFPKLNPYISPLTHNAQDSDETPITDETPVVQWLTAVLCLLSPELSPLQLRCRLGLSKSLTQVRSQNTCPLRARFLQTDNRYPTDRARAVLSFLDLVE